MGKLRLILTVLVITSGLSASLNAQSRIIDNRRTVYHVQFLTGRSYIATYQRSPSAAYEAVRDYLTRALARRRQEVNRYGITLHQTDFVEVQPAKSGSWGTQIYNGTWAGGIYSIKSNSFNECAEWINKRLRLEMPAYARSASNYRIRREKYGRGLTSFAPVPRRYRIIWYDRMARRWISSPVYSADGTVRAPATPTATAPAKFTPRISPQGIHLLGIESQ